MAGFKVAMSLRTREGNGEEILDCLLLLPTVMGVQEQCRKLEVDPTAREFRMSGRYYSTFGYLSRWRGAV